MAVDYFAGNDYDIGIALQSAQGVAADDSQFRTFVTAGGVMPVKDTAPIEETSDERLLTDDYVSGVRAEGGPQIVVRPKIIGLLLYGAMGTKAVSGSGDPYTHTITLAKRLPYFTVWTRLGDSVDGLFTKIVDCKIASLSLASSANGLLMATVNFLGTSPAHAAAAEATASIEAAGTAFLHADGSGALKIETVSVATIEQQELTIDNGAALQTGDSVEGYAVTEARQNITWATTMLVQDFDLWRRYLYGTDAPSDGDSPSRDVLELTGGLDFKWTRPGSPERSIHITAPRVLAVPATVEPNVNGDPLKYSVEHRVRRANSGSSLTAVVKNGLASYPAAS